MLPRIICSRRNGCSKAKRNGLVDLLHDASANIVRVGGIGRPEKPLRVIEGRCDVERLIQATAIVSLCVSGGQALDGLKTQNKLRQHLCSSKCMPLPANKLTPKDRPVNTESWFTPSRQTTPRTAGYVLAASTFQSNMSSGVYTLCRRIQCRPLSVKTSP